MSASTTMQFRPFRDSLLLGLLATAMVQLKVARAEVVLDHFVEVKMFEPVTIMFLAAIGISMYRSIPGGFVSFYTRESKLLPRAFEAYAPVSGAFSGWAICLCGFEFAHTGMPAAPAIAYVLFALLYLVGVPLGCYKLVASLTEHYSSTGPAQKNNPALVRLLSAAMPVVAVAYMWHWVTHG